MKLNKEDIKNLEKEAKKIKKTPNKLDSIYQSLRVKQRNIDHLYTEIDTIRDIHNEMIKEVNRAIQWLEMHSERITKQELNNEELRRDYDVLITRIDKLESNQ